MREHRIKLGNLRMEVSLSEVLEVVGSCKKIEEAAEKLGCHKVELIYFLRKFIKREGFETWASAAKRFEARENPVFRPSNVLIEILRITAKSDSLSEAGEKTKLKSYLSKYLLEVTEHRPGEQWSEAARHKLVELGAEKWREPTKKKYAWYKEIFDI